ncbi:MAG: helix-turn-helix domain-containing protein [Burkholderiales bacterium]|nr:helix-turn-helix domain-containing protein [Burkholderiales bacterium]
MHHASYRLQPLLKTTDIDEMTAYVANLFGPHDIQLPRPRELRFDIQACEIGGLRLGQVGYSAQAEVQVQTPRTGWTLTRALQGNNHFHDSGQQLLRGTMGLMPPHWCGNFTLSPEARFENLHIPEPHLMAVARELLGFEPQEPLDFQMFLPGEAAVPQRLGLWLQTLLHAPLPQGQAHAQLDAALSRALLMELLLLWPHRYTRHLQKPQAPRSAVQRALEFMHAHLEDEIDLPQIAQAAGVGVRALELAFAKQVHTSPWRHLRALRLDQARRLLAEGRETSVLAVALRFGFGNPGLFARYYQQRHGERPGQTLARRLAADG